MQAWLTQLLVSAGQTIAPYIQEISVALIASLLVVFGDSINKFVKKGVSRHNFAVRTGIFVLLCAFGYGALTVFLAPFVAKQLLAISTSYLAPVVVALFVLIGVLAERKNQI